MQWKHNKHTKQSFETKINAVPFFLLTTNFLIIRWEINLDMNYSLIHFILIEFTFIWPLFELTIEYPTVYFCRFWCNVRLRMDGVASAALSGGKMQKWSLFLGWCLATAKAFLWWLLNLTSLWTVYSKSLKDGFHWSSALASHGREKYY